MELELKSLFINHDKTRIRDIVKYARDLYSPNIKASSSPFKSLKYYSPI